MQRNPIIANIYGYTVCLIAVLVFFAGTAAFVGSAFNVVHPTADHVFVTKRLGIGPMGQQHVGMGWRSHEDAGGRFAPNPGGPMLAPPPFPPNAAFAAAHEGGRAEALRRLLVSLALLILAGVLFARHWHWLRGEHASS